MIIYDTREQQNQHILDYLDKKKIKYKKQKINEGDYTAIITAREDMGITRDLYFNIAVERKNSVDELAGNLGEKRDDYRDDIRLENLIFKGKIDDLMDLKIWIKKYFALQNEEVYTGTRFIYENEKASLVTRKGSLNSAGINSKVVSDGGANIDITDTQITNEDDLRELLKYLFKFITFAGSISIIGTIINNLTVAHSIKAGVKLHHLLIAGESGSGKSTILENVIAPILNYSRDDIKSIGLVTKFALTKNLSDGNYTILFDEFKPSQFDQYKSMMISETLRNSYDRHVIDRGSKNLKSNKTFALTRPIILAGEESFPNNEKALLERSCIVYLSKNKRTEEQTKAIKWICMHEEILNSFGRSLIDEILNLTLDEYKRIRENAAAKISVLENRPLSTAVNICTGIEILNKLLREFDIEEINNYQHYVVENITAEVLDNRKEVLSEVEQILKLYNDMIEDSRAFEPENIIRRANGQIFIRTSEMFNQINQHIKNIGLRKHILEIGDFKKQAKKAGYLLKSSEKVLSVNSKATKFDEYSANKLMGLGAEAIIPPDVTEAEWDKGEQQIIYPQFTKNTLPK